jgi:hypothetical protein
MRLQDGIYKPKQYTDGIMRYGKLTSSGEPNILDEALGNKNWKAAMGDEIVALHKNKTWSLVPPKKGRNIIDCMWVFKIKQKADGSIDRYCRGSLMLAVNLYQIVCPARMVSMRDTWIYIGSGL